MYVLDREAAEEDAQKYITKCGNMMRDLLYDFSMARMNVVWENLDYIPGDEVFTRFLYGFNLAPLKNSYYNDTVDVDVDVDRVVNVNLVESIGYTFFCGYSYAAGGDISNNTEIEAFLRLSNVYSKLTAATQGYIYMAKPGRMVEDSILETVSPRYAHAVALATARSQFTISVIYARKIDATSAGITPRVLYTLAGVTNGYIMQLIREDKLIADKKDGLWSISTLSALAWLQNRDNCPDWVKKL